MNKDNLRKIYLSLEDLFSRIQNTFQTLSIVELTKGINKNQEWPSLQMANVVNFQSKIETLGNKYLYKLDKEIESSLSNTLKESSLDKKVSKEELSNKMNNYKMITALAMATLIKETSRLHLKQISEISYQINQGYVLNDTQKLYNVICEQVTKFNSPENVPKVTYSDGRKFEWQAYMNMAVRTSLETEASTNELASGKEFGIVFYICSQHSDCAEDHIDYQGRIYYDQDYKSMNLSSEELERIEQFISSNKLISIQEIMSGPVYLTTRPNCRHYFSPIPLEEINRSKTDLLNELSMNKGKGDEEEYRNTQIQRYNERQIRKWKSERDNAVITLKNAPKGVDDSIARDRLAKCNLKVTEWQSKQREFVNKHNLERDIEREQIDYLVNDLGTKANKYLHR